jgi:hypothetical protein
VRRMTGKLGRMLSLCAAADTKNRPVMKPVKASERLYSPCQLMLQDLGCQGLGPQLQGGSTYNPQQCWYSQGEDTGWQQQAKHQAAWERLSTELATQKCIAAGKRGQIGSRE